MMGYYGSWGMMGGAGLIGSVIWVVVLVDLVLLGIWLWKRITKE